MRQFLLMTACALLTAAGAAIPTPARACTYGAGLDLVEPADGAEDVPTDVVPWLRGWSGDSGPTGVMGTPRFGDGGVEGIAVTLQDASGADVPFDLEVHSAFPYRGAVEVRPREPLMPRTPYTLAVYESGLRKAYGFVTGDGPLDASPPALEPSMQVADRSSRDTSCEHNSYACVSIPDDTTVHATVTTSDGTVEGELIWGQLPSDFQWIRQAKAADSPFCIELRARAINGELGPASTVCSMAARTFDFEEGDHVLQCEGARIRIGDRFLDEESGGGCSAAGAPPGAWPALVVLVLLGAIRRRRRLCVRS